MVLLFLLWALKLIFIVSNGLLSITFFLVMKMRKNAKESLNIAFGKEKTSNELTQIMRACFFNLD